MKKLLLSFVLMISCLGWSQDYHYKFKLDQVTNLGEAKYATDVFRHLFEVFPTFDDSNDQFDFISVNVITQEELALVLNAEGYVILSFERIEIPNDPDDEK